MVKTKIYKATTLKVPPEVVKFHEEVSNGMNEALAGMLTDDGRIGSINEVYVAISLLGPYFDLEKSYKEVSGKEDGEVISKDGLQGILFGIAFSYMLGSGRFIEGYYIPDVPTVEELHKFHKISINGKTVDMDTFVSRVGKLTDGISDHVYDVLYKESGIAMFKKRSSEADLMDLFSVLASMLITCKKIVDDM